MKQLKKVLAVTLCSALAVGTVIVPADSDAAAKLKLSAKSITLKVGQTKALTLKKGKKNVTKKAKWSTNNKVVATVSKGKVKAKSAGFAVITAKFGKKCTCKVKVTGSSSNANTSNTGTSTTPGTSTRTVTTPTSVPFNVAPNNNPGGSTTPTTAPTPTEAPVVDDFNFATDCTVTYGEVNKHVEFQINKETTSEDELRDLGYDVNNGVAAKDTLCPTATYTFTKLPDTLTEIQQIPLDKEFGPMAATICAFATAQVDKYNMQNISSCPTNAILDYLNGASRDFAVIDQQFLASSTFPNLRGGYQKCYFDGAEPTNSYTPNEPLTFTLYVGPYYIPEKTMVTGKLRPETHMVLIKFGGDDSERYIDVYQSSKDQKWYSYEDQWKHMGASFKPIQERL